MQCVVNAQLLIIQNPNGQKLQFLPEVVELLVEMRALSKPRILSTISVHDLKPTWTMVSVQVSSEEKYQLLSILTVVHLPTTKTPFTRPYEFPVKLLYTWGRHCCCPHSLYGTSTLGDLHVLWLFGGSEGVSAFSRVAKRD